ncbi:MAG: hypothetical protein ABEH66_02125 [Halobacteriales archaeon]
MDLTILEIHLDDAAFNPPLSGGDGEDDDDRAGAPADSTTGGAASVARLLGTVAVLLGLALLARYLRSGEEEDLPAADDVEIAEA